MSNLNSNPAYAQARIYEADEDPAEDYPTPQEQRNAGYQFSIGWRRVSGQGFAMNGVVENDGGHEKDHFDQKGPVEIVHVRVGREQQQPGKEHQHQTA